MTVQQQQAHEELVQVETALEKVHARMYLARRYELRDLVETATCLEEQALYLRAQLS